jgi:hypothetical protein
MSLGMPRISTATRAPSMAKGTAMITASGSDHFSYWAARIRKTMMMPNTKAMTEALPVRFSWKAWPTHSVR